LTLRNSTSKYGWSEFREISSTPALNIGHQRAINRPKCQTWCCEVSYRWGHCLPALILVYTVITLRSSLVVIMSLWPWRPSALYRTKVQNKTASQ